MLLRITNALIGLSLGNQNPSTYRCLQALCIERENYSPFSISPGVHSVCKSQYTIYYNFLQLWMQLEGFLQLNTFFSINFFLCFIFLSCPLFFSDIVCRKLNQYVWRHLYRVAKYISQQLSRIASSCQAKQDTFLLPNLSGLQQSHREFIIPSWFCHLTVPSLPSLP